MSDREHFTCHREGDLCAWDGCPRQYDDKACEQCFLIQPKTGMSDLLRIAEDVLTDHAPTTCTQLDTCACSMAALHREVRHLRDTETKETEEPA